MSERRVQVSTLRPKPCLIEIERIVKKLHVQITQVGTGLTHFLKIDQDRFSGSDLRHVVLRELLDRLKFDSETGVPHFYDKDNVCVASGKSGFQARVDVFKTKFEDEIRRYETEESSKRLRSAFRARAIRRQLNDMIESQQNGLNAFDEETGNTMWRERCRLLRDALREAEASRDRMGGFLERGGKKKKKEEKEEEKEDEEQEEQEEMASMSRISSITSTMTMRSEISMSEMEGDLEEEEEEEEKVDIEAIIEKKQSPETEDQTGGEEEEEEEEEEENSTISIAEKRRISKDERRERDRKLMRRQRKRYLRRKRRRERKARKQHEAFMKVRPKSPISKDDLKERRALKNPEMSHPCFCLKEFLPRQLRLWDPRDLSPVLQGYHKYRTEDEKEDFFLLSTNSKKNNTIRTTHPVFMNRTNWEIKRAKPHDSRVTNPIFMNYRRPPTEEEIQQALRERRLRRRRQLVAKFTSAYKRGNNLPCHVCCHWSSSDGCPCCSNRGVGGCSNSKTDVLKRVFNFQTAATLRDEREQTSLAAATEMGKNPLMKVSKHMSIAQWNNFRNSIYVRVIVKSLPSSGGIIELTVNAETMTIEYLYKLYRANAGNAGRKPNVKMYVPTQYGIVYLSNMPRNRDFTLSDYRIRERQQDICIVACNAVTETQTEAMITSYLRKNIVLSKDMIREMKIVNFCSEIGKDVNTSTDSVQNPLKNFLKYIVDKETLIQREELRDSEIKRNALEKAGYVEKLKKHVKLRALTRATSVAMHVFKLNRGR